MARLKVDFEFKNFVKKLEKARKPLRDAAREAVNECSIDLQREAKKRAPVSSGRLRTDIQIDFFEGGLASNTGNSLDYAPHVEFGSGPHGTSKGSADFIRSITRWARLVLGLSEEEVYPIIRKIRREGTPAQPYLTPAWEMVRPKCERLIREILFKAAKRALT